MKYDFHITGKMKRMDEDFTALCEYIADGILHRDGLDIPCRIGYEYQGVSRDCFNPSVIFIDAQVLPNGKYIFEEIINFRDKNNWELYEEKEGA